MEYLGREKYYGKFITRIEQIDRHFWRYKGYKLLVRFLPIPIFVKFNATVFNALRVRRCIVCTVITAVAHIAFIVVSKLRCHFHGNELPDEKIWRSGKIVL